MTLKSTVRCAIYTRVSTEQGLEQDFNSLGAQDDASRAYIRSQATASADNIATRENCSARKINMTISLAFLAPDLVKAAIDGRLRYGLGVARLSDLPAEWSRQHQVLGLPGQ